MSVTEGLLHRNPSAPAKSATGQTLPSLGGSTEPAGASGAPQTPDTDETVAFGPWMTARGPPESPEAVSNVSSSFLTLE